MRDLLQGAADDILLLAGLVSASVGVEFGHAGLVVFGGGLIVVVVLGSRR